MRYIHCILAITLASLCCANLSSEPDKRPNILWITSEDNSAHHIGCYGNELAQTPNIDSLASRGFRYVNAFANVPVCAPARSALITGVHAVSQGTHNMRSRYPLPPHIRPYITLLRDAGYYCTNNEKTDYNFEGDDASFWDQCGPDAHYDNRTADQPFFAIFNFNQSHESSLFPEKVNARRSDGSLPTVPRISAKDVIVPPYLPDTPEIRQDLAIYHDAITLMDQKVGQTLRELEERGLADDTIVFYYSDHGGILPRSKRYVYDTGTRVPLVVYFPEKYRHLAPDSSAKTIERLVSFLDLPPTVLELAGVSIPAYMQGLPLFSAGSQTQTAPQWVLLTGDRFDQKYKLNRAVTDGRYRYIRNFYPEQSAALQIPYPYQMASWTFWKNEWTSGNLNTTQAQLWQATQAVEELYDTQTDPWEINNLAASPDHQERLETMRNACQNLMIEYNDLGLIPEPMYSELAGNKSIYGYAHSKAYQPRQIAELAFRASEVSPANAKLLFASLESDSPVARYWGLRGLTSLVELKGFDISKSENDLRDLARNDPSLANQILASSLLYRQFGDSRYLQKIGAINSSTTSSALKYFAEQQIAKLQ